MSKTQTLTVAEIKVQHLSLQQQSLEGVSAYPGMSVISCVLTSHYLTAVKL